MENKCTICSAMLPGRKRKYCEECFVSLRKKDRHSPEYKTYNRAYAVERYRRRSPEVKAAMQRNAEAWRAKSPITYLVSHARVRAKRKGLEFNISASDVTPATVCPWLGIPLFFGTVDGRAGPNTPSLDRIDSSRGYVRGNVEIVSWRANQLKVNATLDEIEMMGLCAAKRKGAKK